MPVDRSFGCRFRLTPPPGPAVGVWFGAEQVSRPPLLYPYWHQAASVADRMSPADRALHHSHLSG